MSIFIIPVIGVNLYYNVTVLCTLVVIFSPVNNHSSVHIFISFSCCILGVVNDFSVVRSRVARCGDVI